MKMLKSIICLFNIQDVYIRFRIEVYQDVVGRFNERYINYIVQLIKYEFKQSRLIKCCNKKKKVQYIVFCIKELVMINNCQYQIT